MYLRCPECKTRYEIAASSIPDGGARVRCPRCRTVFTVARPMGPPEEGLAVGPGADGASAAPVVGADRRLVHRETQPPLSAAVRPARDAAVDESTAAAVAQAMGLAGDPAPNGAEVVAGEEGGGREARRARESAESPVNDTGDRTPQIASRRERIPGAGARPIPPAANVVVPGAPVDADLARRIARALVSELLMARRDQRNEALREGRILARLGAAILETNERYRERVGDALADDTRYFQDAVNEIIGDGRPLL